MVRLMGIACALLSLLACAPPDPLTGTWRAVLSSPGGELPFTLRIGDAGALPAAVAINGEEAAPFTSVSRSGSRVVLRIDGYDSEIVAEVQEGETRMDGEWRRAAPGGISRLSFSARRGDARRFRPVSPREAVPEAPTSVAGIWAVRFTDAEESWPARAELTQEGSRVTGTFLNPGGDYRFLEGDFLGGRLRLSTFDGGHAFLFHARATPEGDLEGDFWSRDVYHATWTARRAEHHGGEAKLPDPFSVVGLTNDEGLFRFSFPDLDGNPVSLDDARFAGRAVLVNLFGSWCPNCNDEAPLLGAWYRKYRGRGLEIVGLAFEITGQVDRDRSFVRKYAARHGIEYPLLLAGTSDKGAASESLPDLTEVAAFPTTVFIGRDGRVRWIHSGFSGPGTGDHHRRLVAQFEARIDELLSEPAPDLGEPGPAPRRSPRELRRVH